MAGSGFAKTALFRLSNATSDAGAGIEVTVVTKTTDFTLGTATDVILADASAGAITISLPAAANASGKLFWIKKIDSSANLVTVDPDGSECIDQYTSLALCERGDAVQIVSNASQWWII
jgi:hypothetical protein